MRNFWRRNQLKLTPWIMLSPGLILFVVYILYPIIQSIGISFYDWDGLGEKTYIGFANYAELFDDEAFYVSLNNNFLWLIFSMLSIPTGLLLALFLNQTVFGMRFYKSMFFFPFVISQVVIGLVFVWFYNPNQGVLNLLLTGLGFRPIDILGDERYATYGVILSALWPKSAYCMILYLTGLNAIDNEQIEAARLDNAKGFNMLRHIILPQLRPATFIAIVVTVIGALSSFDSVSIMTGGGPWGSTRVLAYYMYEKAFSEYGFRMGYSAAIAVILFLLIMSYVGIVMYRMYKNERRG